ncbi:MAG: hypothetical protein KatS3mg114_0180 [Planctomycetaceae bacterium]|nr:MAG: hypothetical protein KatS3mg114_0180 [Planctomycetaceae bacterium]
MRVPLTIPDKLWSGVRISLAQWLVEPGEEVEADDLLAELFIPGMLGELRAPAAGRVLELMQPPLDGWQPGAVVGWLEVTTVREIPDVTHG